MANLTWTHNAPVPTSGALNPPLPCPLPNSVPQTFSINDVALVQYFGGTFAGTPPTPPTLPPPPTPQTPGTLGDCVINNTSVNSLMVANGAYGALIGGLGCNGLLGGPGPSELFGRGTRDFVVANYAVVRNPNNINKYLLTTAPPAFPGNNYVYDWPSGSLYSYVLFGPGDLHNVNASNVILPDDAGGLTTLEWLQAVLRSSADIVSNIETCASENGCLLLDVLPDCPNDALYANPNG